MLRDPVLDLAERVEDLRRTGEKRHLIATAVDRMLREDPEYQREFDELYGPGLAAMRAGDFVSAAPGPDFGLDD